jgi:2-polyprenyl-3-methyl-5-hydroxy-6-metoxy-1,4-benzoquinol methylase
MADHTCPIWVGYLLASPLRKLIENPDKILRPHVKEGMTALDVGSAMGFFSLPLAKMVNTKGKVVCVDLQQKMLDSLVKRARKAGVAKNIETRLASESDLNIKALKGTIDVALAFHIVHEVNNQESFFIEIFEALKSKGKLLFSEPAGHVSKDDFNKSLSLAEKAGFIISQTQGKRRSRSALLEKI